MKFLIDLISEQLAGAFERAGFDAVYGKATLSNRPDLCEYQCNGAMAGAKKYKKAPIMIANAVVEELADSKYFASAEAVRLKLLTPLQELREKLKGQHTGAEFCSMLYQFLTEQQVEEQLNRQLKVIADEQKRMQTSEEWALVWNSFIDILEQLSMLYRRLEMEFSEFSTVFAALTGNIQRATPPRTLDAVLISQGSTARLNAPKIVFLLGVCEGTFPAFPGCSMVFSERDCEFLPEDVQLSVAKPAESQMADARLAAYKLLSSASHALYLTYPVVDVTHQKCYPSAVIAQIQRTFPEAETLHQNCASLEPSYYSVTMHAAYYQYVQNYAAHNTDTACCWMMRHLPRN